MCTVAIRDNHLAYLPVSIFGPARQRPETIVQFPCTCTAAASTVPNLLSLPERPRGVAFYVTRTHTLRSCGVCTNAAATHAVHRTRGNCEGGKLIISFRANPEVGRLACRAPKIARPTFLKAFEKPSVFVRFRLSRGGRSVPRRPLRALLSDSESRV